MLNQDSFITIQPKITKIKDHISYYYFHQSFDSKFKKSFTFYPNYIHGLTVYKNSSVIFGQTNIVTPSKKNEFTILYTMNYDRNIKVSLNGIFNKIGICFQPAGLNHFTRDNLSNLYDRESYKFDHFGDEFEATLFEVYSVENIEKKRDLLDQFFLKRLDDFKFPKLIACLEEIIESNGTIKVETLSQKYVINRKTLLRLFQKHFCCTVEEYKKMVKFRNTLNFTQSQERFNTLTEISLYNHYYDQADFNKQFRSITNFTPKELLSKIKKVGDEGTYWVFE